MSTAQDLDNLLKGFVQSTVPGCACAVAQKGNILYEGYHSISNLSLGAPVTPDTVYRLFSMTKVII